MSPREVAPVVHQGVRYEAPHWYQSEEVKPPELSARERMMQVLQQSADPSNPAALFTDPARCREVLESKGFSSPDIELMDRHLESERVLRRVITQSLHELIAKSLSQGGPPNPMAAISPEWLLEALEKDGTLSGEQRQEAVSRWQASQQALQRGLESLGGQHGGWLVASQDEGGGLLWSLRVYEPEEGEDVFITSLAMEGEYLLVRDEKRREYRVDLNLRRVV
ncbi:MAG: hypothetical protein KIS61_08660 [Candidatus Eremiobacteraeota bacterium]|nr:hypothetical protein [Candidatus Eremiobacteraeota bacterium]